MSIHLKAGAQFTVVKKLFKRKEKIINLILTPRFFLSAEANGEKMISCLNIKYQQRCIEDTLHCQASLISPSNLK